MINATSKSLEDAVVPVEAADLFDAIIAYSPIPIFPANYEEIIYHLKQYKTPVQATKGTNKGIKAFRREEHPILENICFNESYRVSRDLQGARFNNTIIPKSIWWECKDLRLCYHRIQGFLDEGFREKYREDLKQKYTPKTIAALNSFVQEFYELAKGPANVMDALMDVYRAEENLYTQARSAVKEKKRLDGIHTSVKKRSE